MRLAIDVFGSVRTDTVGAPVAHVTVQLATTGKDGTVLHSATTDEAGRFRISCRPTDSDRKDQPKLGFRVVHPTHGELALKGSKPSWTLDREHYDLRVALPKKQGSAIHLCGPNHETVDLIEPGDDLRIRRVGLEPSTPVEVTVEAEGMKPFVTRFLTDREGTLGPAVLWPQLGLSGRGDKPVSIDEAAEQWAGSAIRISVDQNGNQEETEIALAERPVRPLVALVNSDGVLRNMAQPGREPVGLAGRRVPPADGFQLLVVPRQSRWQHGDPVEAVRLRTGEPALLEFQTEGGSFDQRIFRPQQLNTGQYDLVLRPLRYGWEDDEITYLTARDIVVGRGLTGLVIREDFMASKFVRGGCTNLQEIAGRKLSGTPYFRYSNVFAVGEEVWGALDPNALDPNHVGKMAAFYVVPSKSAAQWSADRSLQHLPVLGGNPAVPTVRVQDYCINANDVLLWPSAEIGEYDVVADFGNNATDPAAFTADNSFDDPLDIIDGYAVAGFKVVDDPATMTEYPGAGSHSYNEPAITVQDHVGTSRVVPVQANVFFPVDGASMSSSNPAADISAAQTDYPVFVAVHGQSGAPDSYTGYDYLLEHLARNGFIAVSVHCISGMRGEDRARVAFHHLTRLSALFGAKMQNNVCIMGHSRGGEAAASAVRLNVEDSEGWNINGAIALAPTDRYTFEEIAGTWATPFQVIYGSMDGDVAGVERTGFRLYDRAKGEPKSMHFVHGSSHGRYNTVWGDTDITEPWSKLEPADIPTLITAAAHRTIAKAYMTAFALKSCRGQDDWTGMLAGDWQSPAVAAADSGSVRIFTQYQGPGPEILDDFETGTAWTSSTSGGAVGDDNTLPVDPAEGDLHTLDGQSPHDTDGLALRWDDANDVVWFDVPAALRDTSAQTVMSFRVGQTVGSASNPAGNQDMHVALVDGAGDERAIRVSKFAEIPEPHERARSEFTLSAMNTIRIPLHAWSIRVAGNMGIDLSDVRRVRFDFSAWDRPTGEIVIDDIEFTD